jgi:hypothetical protein
MGAAGNHPREGGRMNFIDIEAHGQAEIFTETVLINADHIVAVWPYRKGGAKIDLSTGASIYTRLEFEKLLELLR